MTPREKYKLKFIENYTNVKMKSYDISSAKSLNETKYNGRRVAVEISVGEASTSNRRKRDDGFKRSFKKEDDFKRSS